jgi:hypothetical protein
MGGANTYTYASNNPISRRDRNGLITECELTVLRDVVNKYGYGPRVTPYNFGTDPNMVGHSGYTNIMGESKIGTNPSEGLLQYSGSVVANGQTYNVINTALHENVHQAES